MIRIALDAMGGDHAPDEIVKGAFLASKNKSIFIFLVGPIKLIQEAINQHVGGPLPSNIELHHASEIVGMSESPSLAFKKKQDSSIRVGLKLVKESKADAFVSAGNTGAVMAASLLTLGRIPGVERPGIATVLPTTNGKVVMLDMGSTVDCKPSHLCQFAIMGDCFSKFVLGIQSPRVGLLNIGEEVDKGNQLTLAAYPLLETLPIRFIGNVESKGILFDTVDVVVCDGFVGNSLLKFGEGLASFFSAFFKKECKKSILSFIGALLMKPVFNRLRKKTDHEEVGGAPLLGVNGVSIIAHGSSGEKAVMNAIYTAYEAVQMNMNHHIAVALKNE